MKKHSFLSKMKATVVYIFICLIAIGLPVFFDRVILMNGNPSELSAEVWLNFLGSYSGGIATLLAVLITIRHEQNRAKKEQEAQQLSQYQKSACIIYFNLANAFERIISCLAVNNTIANCDTFEATKAYSSRIRKRLHSLNLDPTLLNTILDLKDSPEIDVDTFNSIIIIYDDLRTIQNALEINEERDFSIFNFLSKYQFVPRSACEQNQLMLTQNDSCIDEILQTLAVVAKLPDKGKGTYAIYRKRQ